MASFPVIKTKDGIVSVHIDNREKHFTLEPLPPGFIDWQITERLKVFEFLRRGEKPAFLSPHLPTLLTLSDINTDHPINAASKGVGLVPLDEELPSLTTQLQESLKTLQGSDQHSALNHRLNAAMLLYGNQEKINRFCLGGLEIFETKSFSNIIRDPRVSLFFVGNFPLYQCYQINCIAEIIDVNQDFYKFVTSMRGLFEMENFHFQQPMYPYAIKYHTIQVFDKSLKVRDK